MQKGPEKRGEEKGIRVRRQPVDIGSLLGGPFDLGSRVSKVGYGGL